MIFEVGIHHEDDQTRHRTIGIVLRAHLQSKQRLQHQTSSTIYQLCLYPLCIVVSPQQEWKGYINLPR